MVIKLQGLGVFFGTPTFILFSLHLCFFNKGSRLQQYWQTWSFPKIQRIWNILADASLQTWDTLTTFLSTEKPYKAVTYSSSPFCLGLQMAKYAVVVISLHLLSFTALKHKCSRQWGKRWVALPSPCPPGCPSACSFSSSWTGGTPLKTKRRSNLWQRSQLLHLPCTSTMGPAQLSYPNWGLCALCAAKFVWTPRPCPPPALCFATAACTITWKLTSAARSRAMQRSCSTSSNCTLPRAERPARHSPERLGSSEPKFTPSYIPEKTFDHYSSSGSSKAPLNLAVPQSFAAFVNSGKVLLFVYELLKHPVTVSEGWDSHNLSAVKKMPSKNNKKGRNIDLDKKNIDVRIKEHP